MRVRIAIVYDVCVFACLCDQANMIALKPNVDPERAGGKVEASAEMLGKTSLMICLQTSDSY